MLIIVVGDTSLEFSAWAQQRFPDSRLMTDHDVAPNLHGTFYTCLGDLSIENFVRILESADRIVYWPQGVWSHKQRMQQEAWLRLFSIKKSVENCPEGPGAMPLADHRKTQEKQLWIVGCSYTYGSFINAGDRWGQIVSDRLGLTASWLAAPGSSIAWAADQILRSDIRANDIVLWGITGVCRDYQHVDRTTVTHRTAQDPGIPKHVLSPGQLYRCVEQIQAVSNFLDKVGADYRFGLFPMNTEEDLINLQWELFGRPKTFALHYQHGCSDPDHFVDYASDLSHPGPQQNQIFAAAFLNELGVKT